MNKVIAKKMYKFLILSCLLVVVSACRPAKYNPRKADVYSPIIEIETDMGNIEVQLYAGTPKHRDNFVKLVKEGFYSGTLFHRVINTFMIQAGDPDSKGAKSGIVLGNGGPGYNVPAELEADYYHTKGALAAARMPDQVNPKKESSGSQFYIVQGSKVTDQLLDKIESMYGFKYTDAQRELYKKVGGTPHLDKNYTIFGQVISGMEVVEKIAAVRTDANNRPGEDIKIKKMRIKKG
jgi:cyclophilin family peptidyl-prolyl cis-trans isomerase